MLEEVENTLSIYQSRWEDKLGGFSEVVKRLGDDGDSDGVCNSVLTGWDRAATVADEGPHVI